MAKTIAIVGAGAKAAAIVARARILRDLGAKNVPDIMVFEAEHIGAAWSGAARFSSGFLPLCTPGEKDVGFPYNESRAAGSLTGPVSPALFARFSWSAFLVAEGRVTEWIDRGRSHPTHRAWSEYLKWVFEQAGQAVTEAEVTTVRQAGAAWEVSFTEKTSPSSRTIVADGIVLTGTGRSRTVATASTMPANRACDAETFWPIRDQFLKLKDETIIVVGDGGGAGTIVAWLAEQCEERDVRIISINPMGTLFPRGDGYAERRWFSDPSDWPDLSLQHRRNLLERTEAGVISLRIKRVIDEATNVEYCKGRAVSARDLGDEVEVAVEYDGKPAPAVRGDYLVSAIGFDGWSLLSLVQHPAVQSLIDPAAGQQRAAVEAAIDADLTLPTSLGLPGGIHIPGLSGLARGPGMSNLGCLGLMALAVLDPYVTI